MKDKRRDSDLKYYNRLIRDANGYKENLSDKELWDNVKLSRSVILPCFHEGFGYTAFEAGIFGVVPVILTKGNDHATTEYLTRANVKHFSVEFNDENAIYNIIDESLKVTIEDRLDISNKFLKYFSVENYINNRIELMDSAKKINTQINTLEDFFN